MTRAVAISAAIAVLSVVDGARMAKHRGNPGIKIVNGTDAEACVYKWQVGLYNSGASMPSCGGSLISPTWVVTAKHCVGGSSYDVMAGSILPGQGERRTSKRIVKKADTDMALIELSEPFTLDECLNVPLLPTSEIPDGSQCWITGWGRLGASDPQPSTLQQAATNVVGFESCNSQMNGRINSSDVCVFGEYNGNPTSGCYGDSGGPLVCQVEGDSEFTLFGATSWGYSCVGITVYDGVFSAMDWINSYAFPEPTPAPVPTPAPPPGSWSVSGSGCSIDGDCVSSSNHPSEYGNNQECTLSVYEVALTVDAFSTESGYDKLTVDGTDYSGSSGPPSGTYTAEISWSTDFSVVNSGWKFCKA